MLRTSENARNRIYDGLRKYSRIVAQARARGMNAHDTGDVVKAMLGDMLGYDPFFDVTSEIAVRGPHADHAVSIDNQLQFLLIVKAIGTVPHAAHLLRLGGANVPTFTAWAVATNADTWACYRLGVGTDRHPELAFRVSLLDGKPVDEKLALFAMLSKDGVQQNALNEYWQRSRAVNAHRVASLLLSEELLTVLRREINRITHGGVEKHTLRDILIREVLRPEALTPLQGTESAPPQPECYAYVANPNDPATWRLYYRNADGTPDPERLVIAASELRDACRAVEIPPDDVPLVKQRLREAYLELGVSIHDLPADLSLP